MHGRGFVYLPSRLYHPYLVCVFLGTPCPYIFFFLHYIIFWCIFWPLIRVYGTPNVTNRYWRIVTCMSQFELAITQLCYKKAAFIVFFSRLTHLYLQMSKCQALRGKGDCCNDVFGFLSNLFTGLTVHACNICSLTWNQELMSAQLQYIVCPIVCRISRPEFGWKRAL